MAETRHLAADGVVELCLVAEDTTSYGRDWDGRGHLPELLRQLTTVDEVHWLRLLYTHPAHWSDDLIAVVAEDPRICRYVDLPIQHASDRVLQAMGRGVTGDDIRSLVERLRNAVPGLMIRTSVIVGFPGETEAEFQELMDFLQEVRFERLGAFSYSREVGSPAFDLPDQVPEDEREARRQAVMELQQEMAFQFNSGLLERVLPVIVDRSVGPGEPQALGRTYGDAPDVDGAVYLQGDGLQLGEIWEARIIGSRGYDLEGVAVRRLHAYQPETMTPADP
jgi:ribosomal protein S12 methylthiotransferase